MARNEYFKTSKNLDLDKIRALASLGLDYSELAGCLGISAKTFSRRRQENPEIEDAIIAGRGQGVADVAESLKARAIAGDPAACKIYLQALGANFGKKATVNLEAGPSIKIVLTGANGEEITQS